MEVVVGQIRLQTLSLIFRPHASVKAKQNPCRSGRLYAFEWCHLICKTYLQVFLITRAWRQEPTFRSRAYGERKFNLTANTGHKIAGVGQSGLNEPISENRFMEGVVFQLHPSREDRGYWLRPILWRHRSLNVNKHGGGVNGLMTSHVNKYGGRLASGGHVM